MIDESKNGRLYITIPHDLKSKLQDQADKESRSMSNLVVKVLKDYLENKELAE